MNQTNLFGDTLGNPRAFIYSTGELGTFPTYFSVSSAQFTSLGTTVTFTGVQANVTVKAGDFLYSPTNTQVKKIDSIKQVGNNCIAIIESAFAADVTTAEDVKLVRDPKMRKITFQVQADSTSAYIDGSEFEAPATLEFSNANGLQPIAYDANNATLVINITY